MSNHSKIEDISVGIKVRYVGSSDQFAAAQGTVSQTHPNGRFNVAYDCLPSVYEEMCQPEDWARA